MPRPALRIKNVRTAHIAVRRSIPNASSIVRPLLSSPQLEIQVPVRAHGCRKVAYFCSAALFMESSREHRTDRTLSRLSRRASAAFRQLSHSACTGSRSGLEPLEPDARRDTDDRRRPICGERWLLSGLSSSATLTILATEDIPRCGLSCVAASSPDAACRPANVSPSRAQATAGCGDTDSLPLPRSGGLGDEVMAAATAKTDCCSAVLCALCVPPMPSVRPREASACLSSALSVTEALAHFALGDRPDASDVVPRCPPLGRSSENRTALHVEMPPSLPSTRL